LDGAEVDGDFDGDFDGDLDGDLEGFFEGDTVGGKGKAGTIPFHFSPPVCVESMNDTVSVAGSMTRMFL